MTDAPDGELSPLGRLLEDARVKLSLSKREAAVRAGISETRWRQVVTGRQKTGDRVVESRPRRQTVLAMARAVGADVSGAMDLAGYARLPDLDDSASTADRVHDLIDEIWADTRIPEERKAALVRMIRQAEAERQAVEDELRRWRSA